MNKRLYVLLLSMFVMTLSVAQSPAQGNENEKDSSQTEASDEKKEDVITQPEFKGGIAKFYQYVADNFEYPEEAGKRNVSGTIEVEFTVEKSGDITYASILKGLDFSIDDEILRLVKAMPRWIPATKNGKAVRYTVSMPLNIRASRNKNLKSGIALQDYHDN
ncbi:MAG: energy transducer TonB [Bacteroidaceae bacterium]|nr:energy transducer TonB [Bacteroidaceae bacterium]